MGFMAFGCGGIVPYVPSQFIGIPGLFVISLSEGATKPGRAFGWHCQIYSGIIYDLLMNGSKYDGTIHFDGFAGPIVNLSGHTETVGNFDTIIGQVLIKRSAWVECHRRDR
jgi:hypothetical protein